MGRRISTAAMLCGLMILGCESKPVTNEMPVSGIVTLNGSPLTNAVVIFTPDGDTKGRPGTSGTGPDGKYSIQNPQGQPGLAPGRYRVTVSRMLEKDGTPPPPDVAPADSTAKETLPAIYSNPEKSILNVTVDSATPSYDLTLESRKK